MGIVDSECGKKDSDFRFLISDFRFQISDFRLPTSDFRFLISDFRLLISDSRFLSSTIHFFLLTIFAAVRLYLRQTKFAENLSFGRRKHLYFNSYFQFIYSFPIFAALFFFNVMPDKQMTGNIFFFARRETEQTVPNPPIEAVRRETVLVERVCAGDAEAFNELYKMFAPFVHGIVLARVPRDEAADIVQEVFLTAYKNLDTLRDKAAVGAWLATIARNRANEFYRRFQPTEEISEDLRGKDNPQTEAREILETIRNLPETYRETLILRLVEGLTGAEIAEQTGLTPESVRVNLHRGMKILREKLGLNGAVK